MTQLKVSKDNGQLLFDTNYITYGLVKSGYMVFINAWTRKVLKSAQLDPNDGNNWTLTTASSSLNFADGMWGFTVTNAKSPIVFIVGSGTLNGTQVSGNNITFFYSNASTTTKFYCFDLMGDSIAGSPYLKTYNTSGIITFNSLQPALNIVAAVQAPTPGVLDQFGRYTTVYTGGYNFKRQNNQGQLVAQWESRVDITLGAFEYAACLPWSRSCGISDMTEGNAFSHTMYSGSEGAYGYTGGVSFIMGASGGTTNTNPNTSGYASPGSFFNLPTDRYPVALVIKTAGLPFPYN